MGVWALLISVVAAERTYNNLDANEPSPFPSSCNGSYNLWGNYTVESASVVPGSSCRLNGRFARVLLKAPLIFEGTLNMEGDIAFIGDGSFQQACVTADSVQVGSGTSDDRISFQNCRNMQTSGGGLFVRHELWVNLQASLQVQNCSSRQDGGGIQVEGEVIQFGGHIEIRDCISHSGSAGGLQAGSGLVQLLDSSMSFSRCSAQRHGGCLRVMGDLTLEGKVEMQHCESKGMGGAIAATGTFAQDGGAMQFSHCASKLAGGALRAKAFHQSHGYARFVSCAARVGGALYSLEGVQLGGNNVFESCTAGMGGGGIASWGGSLVQRDGSAQFSECQVYTGSGGAVYLPQGSVYQNGSLTFQNCHAQNGGAVFAKGDLRLGGDVSCRNCTAKVMGGAVAVHGNIWQTGKSLVVESCRASESGGGIYVQKSFFQQSGTVSFQNCSSLPKGHGGCLWTAVFNKSGGSTVFRSCFASRGGGALFSAFSVQLTGPTLFADGLAWGDGGCMQIQHGSLVQFGGSTDFARCTAFMAGGGLHVVAGGLTLASGSMSFTNCTGISKGGGALVEQDVESSGNLTFQTCVSNGQDGGGGLLVRQGDLLQRGGTIHLARCTASHGGGVRIQQGSLRVAAGKMSFVQCHATESAGGMLAHSNVHVSSEMTFKGCVADGARGGGGLLIASGNLTQAGGSLSFEKCAARAGYGGGLNLRNGSLHQKPGGSLLFSRCEARAGGGLAVKRDATLLGFANFRECVARSRDAIRGGGGLYIDYGKLELHGHLEFIQCMTMGNGGAVLVKAGRIATQGNMSIQSCTARRGGGGIYLGGELDQKAGWMEFRDCAAYSGHGGGMWVEGSSSRGHMQFQSCTAAIVQGNGGGLAVKGHLEHLGTMSFSDCSTGGRGGGLYVDSSQPGLLQDVSFDKCSTVGVAGSLFSVGSLSISELKLRCSDGDDACIEVGDQLAMKEVHFQSSSSVSIRASALASSKISCLDTKGCHLLTPRPSRQIAGLLCPFGTGTNDTESEKGCVTCSDNYTQIKPSTVEPCTVCPHGNDVCYPTWFSMQPGHMVEEHDISFTFYCPNADACPGGNSRNFSSMCARGYAGSSCVSCSQGFARSDSSVLLCMQCASHLWKKSAQWSYMLLKRAVPFVLASASALKGEAEAKPSGVLINQLMSFATVAGMLLTVMSQTKVVQEIRGSAGQLPVVLLSTMGLFSQMFSGQASDEGSIFSISSMCLLQYMGFDGFLSQVHLLHSLVPAALVAGLALCLAPEKRGVALVVGLNCFWPEIFSYFGKHLYCYQYAPEVIKQNAYECPFLPDFAGRVILRIVALVLMVAVSGLWIWLSLHKGRNTPLHVLYLTKPYRSGVALWETERLFRKTALTMAVSALPITSSPALQVVCIGSIVSVSLLLYATLLPYKAMRWNLTECVLLFAAALMTTLVSGLTAYDSYWGHVVEIEYAMIVATLFLAGCVFTVMPYLIYSRLKLEWSKECSFQLKDEVERTLSETNDALLWSKFI